MIINLTSFAGVGIVLYVIYTNAIPFSIVLYTALVLYIVYLILSLMVEKIITAIEKLSTTITRQKMEDKY
jgi:diacylglycerol kinase